MKIVMEQGRSKAQIDSNNKIMATFLIALCAFVFFAFVISFVKTKNPYLLEIQSKIAMFKQ
ncbi:hypothetical protein DHW03_02425 [Pedobacter yonginense]|uniref:Uncharacterized protein n=1 Tax=Pedobacter yonginense TaxID=651869 RepID=A0A317ESE2_9SPHI|nr:hypothetical protein DHW03_02425 [Pedobacter yonginense]